VLDADLAAAFDRIEHDQLLDQLATFPARGLIAGWLKAGVVEKGRFTVTEEGTLQGGVVSPLLLNVALHGMAQAAGVRYQTAGDHAGHTVTGSPVVIRYADDLVALCLPDTRRNRSRRGSPRGWRPRVWSSTRTRRASSPSTRGSTS
jgi:RNA-directed DNA polymerase